MIKSVLPVAMILIFGGCSSSADQRADTDLDRTAQLENKSMPRIPLKKIPFETITGEETSLDAYKGQVLLLVNVASRCGNTPQYGALESLYEKYADSGLTVIGFPANNFGNQEPGTNDEILEFCTSRYNVTFPMMAKLSVKGDDTHPLFRRLTDDKVQPGEVKWNFSKFLLDREGNLVARFDPKVQPESEEIVAAIKKLL